MIKYWHDAGTVWNNGNGINSLPWIEIKAWKEENNLDLQSWESSLIRQMSVEYVGEYYAANDKGREAPYCASNESIDRIAVGNKISNVLQSMKKRNKNEPKYVVEENVNA